MPRYAFGPFLLDLEARVLLRDGAPVPMIGKTIDTLIVLVQNRGRLVDKDELLSRVWAGTAVEESSLSQSIFTVRKVLGDSPKDHRYIATLAGRGYQFVAPVTEVASEAPQTSVVLEVPASDSVTIGSLIKRHQRGVVAVVVAAIAAVVGLWFIPHRPAKAPAELMERRLTFNSSASEIVSAAISPDGAYLAYSDPAGIHVRLLSTGEERLIPMPAAVSAGAFSYADSWFPNGTELLVHSRGAGGHGSMWAVSVMGQSSRDLRDDAWGWGVSPDGTRIAFSPMGTGNAPTEIWAMDSQGGNARKVLAVQPDEFVWSARWSPDGHRLAYIRARQGRQWMETCDLKGESRTAVVVAPGRARWVRGVYWLRDGRIVYSQAETTDVDANLWQIFVDTHSGKPIGKPKRITRWARSNLQDLSASADGMRLVLQKVTYPAQVYIGELAAGVKRTGPPQRLTNDEAHDWATAWTADSKSVLFTSDRGGKWGIFKQEIGRDTAEPLIEGRDNVDLPRLSPDGGWVLYAETSTVEAALSPQHRLMRISVNGGVPKLVFETEGARWDDHQCARAPASLCVIIEASHEEQLTVTALDPLRGKGKLLRTIKRSSKEQFSHALSPDGTTLAIARGDEADIHIRLLSLTGGSDREIAVKGWPSIASMDWSADGKGLYCGSTSAKSGTLLYVDLKGAVQVLWQSSEVGGGNFIAGMPSPDGRHVALCGATRNSNAWMVEGF